MASIVPPQEPAFDFFPSTTQPQINTIPSYNWDSSPYTDPAILSDDSLLTSPTTPESTVFPEYTIPREQKPVIKTEEPYDFGTFEDWMRWDEPSEGLSPTSQFFPELKTEPLSPDMSRLEIQGGGNSASRISDEPVVFVEDPVSDEPLFQTSSDMNMSDVPPREGLYSTPLSWSRPTIAQMQPIPTLTPQEEMRLRDIAMPPGSRNSSPSSPISDYAPERKERTRKKRKPSNDDEEMEDEESKPSRHQPPKKTAHNMIEKRYRTNLNDKIAALRDSVPALRVVSKSKSKGEEVDEDLQGLTPAHKLNKATVLSKATEYIAHLEKRNKYLAKENAALKSRVDAFEILVMARQPQPPNQQRNSMARMGTGGWLN